MIADLRGPLRDFLLGDSIVNIAVGGTRIYPLRIPQGITATSVVINDQISEGTDYHMQGPSGLATVRVQIDAWSRDTDAARSLSNAIKSRLGGYRGFMGTVRVQRAFAVNAHADYDQAVDLYRSGRDYMITFEEDLA